MVEPTYGVELSGDATMSGAPGEVVTYTVAVTNTGDVSDTFDVMVSGIWTTTVSVSSVTLDPMATTDVEVYVVIPADASNSDSDVATLTVTSQTDVMATDEADLTTLVGITEIYLPFIMK
jgi:uncharacterized repeat protein (TIGR01451 family)